MARDLFTNQASTTVSASKSAVSAGTTESWTVASSSAFPTASNSTIPPTQFYVADPAAPTELVLVTNVSGTTWSVTRGADGTTPVSHTAGFTIKNVVPAKWLQRLEDRVKKDEFNVLDFGAVGDDSTDCYAGIQAALNAARDAGGGTVIIPKGDYRFQTTPFKIYEGTQIIAHPKAHIKNYAGTDASMMWNGTPGVNPTGYEGNGNILIQGGIWDQRGGTVGGAACFSFAHGRNITFQNLTVRDVRGTHAIEVNGCQGVRVLNCRFEGFYDPGGREYSEAVQFDLMKSSDLYGAFGAYDHTPCDDCLVDGCVFTTSSSANTHEWGRGVGSHSGTIGKWHTNIRVTNCHFDVKHEAVRTYSWNRFTISNNTVYNGSTGFTMECNNAMNATGGPVAGEDTKDVNGVQTNASQDFSDFTVTGNIIYGSQSGETNQPMIWVNSEPTGVGRNGTITGNVITNVLSKAIQLDYAENVTVGNNTVVNASSHAIMANKGTRNLIQGNIVNGCGGIGVYLSGETESSAIGNQVYGANTLGGYAAYKGDGSTGTNSWIGNVARLGSSSYTYGLEITNGTHAIKANDMEAGSSGGASGGRYNISGGTVYASDLVALPPLSNAGATTTGAKGININEVIAPAPGQIVYMQTKLSVGAGTGAQFRPAINQTPTGTNITNTGTSLVGGSQNVPFARGDRIGVAVGNAGSAAGTNLLVTYSVIFDNSVI